MQLFQMARGARNFIALETARATLRSNEERTRHLTNGVSATVEQRKTQLKQLALRGSTHERRRLNFSPSQPSRIAVQRMAGILERIDRAKQRGIPLSQAFGRK